MDSPETRYAKSGDISIAYQVVGDGPFDIVLVPGFVSHVELGWKVPVAARTRERLLEFSRLIVFDKRGTGMSDRVTGAPTLEERMDDVRAVMDAAASTRAAILGVSEGAPMSLLFAAAYPERTAALVLWGGMARMMWAPDYPWGATEETYREWIGVDEQLFGSRHRTLELLRGQGYTGPGEAESLLDYYRSSISPGSMRALRLMNSGIDARHVLPAIHVPTLLVHGSDDDVIPVEGARYMAQRIPGARLVELPGAGHMMMGKVADALVAEVESFLAEVWEEGGWKEGSVTACLRPCSSRTSSTRASGSPSSVTGRGGSCSSGTMRSCGGSSSASAASKSIRRAMGSLPASTAPRVPSPARAQSSRRCASSESKYAPVSTLASAR